MLIFIRENKELFSFSFDSENHEEMKKLTGGLFIDSVSYKFKEPVMTDEASIIIDSQELDKIKSIICSVV